jgi:hypothetical protein
MLVVGEGALTVDGPAPDIMRVKDGLRVIVFEQTCDALTKRLGFRAEEWGLRQVFKRVPDSPLLAGLDTDNLRDWRGEATLLPPHLTYKLGYEGTSPVVEWCGIEVPRIWRCGCRGNVTSVLIEKPACGNFMPILDGGWSLQYSPLMVYREGKGMVLFCQMDVTGRSESDPAAETLVGNIFRYVSSWKATETDRKAIYVGDPAGERHLKHSGIIPAAYEAGKLSPDDVLVVGKGGAETLAADAQSVAAFIKAGGRVLALGLAQDEAQSLLPAVEMKDGEHISTFFESSGGDSLLAGVGPADVFNAAAWHIPLVTGGAQAVGDGVLAKAADANVLFLQLAPYAVTKTEGTAFPSFTVDSGEAANGKQSALVVVGMASGIQLGQYLDPDELAKVRRNSLRWAPQVGRSYTFAVLIKPLSGPVTLHLEVERLARPWDRALKAPETVLPPGKWTELHATFKCAKPFPEGWDAYISGGADGDCFRVGMFRLYEGNYVPWKLETAAPLSETPACINLNPGFEAGTEPYKFRSLEQYNLRRTYRRFSLLMTHVLANMGVACPTPLLGRFSSPVSGKAEARWREGLYVDQVEAWDDPYRYFCW